MTLYPEVDNDLRSFAGGSKLLQASIQEGQVYRIALANSLSEITPIHIAGVEISCPAALYTFKLGF